MSAGRAFRLWAAFLALLLPAAAAAAAPPAATIPVGANIDWSPASDRIVARYLSGPFAMTVRARIDPAYPDNAEPLLTVELAGHPPVEVRGSEAGAGFDHRLTVGRWDEARHFVLFQSFTGGAHCCNHIQLILPEAGRLRVFDLGFWDGEYRDELPTDLDGDGRLDFVFYDNRFLYAFAGYAASFPPLLIMNLVDGEFVDVTASAGFRALLEEDMAASRAACVEGRGQPGGGQNAACAAFVAAAARLGRFDEAWAEMLGAYDREDDWHRGICFTPLPSGECPENDWTFPEALRAFLVELGLIRA